jgi:alanine racemase
MVKRVPAGDGISYGLRHTFERDSTVATVPIGYADGVRRRLGLLHQEVLIGGARHPIVGVVTMDQLMVDCGDAEVAVGDEVVLLGRQDGGGSGAGGEVPVAEWAQQLDTIGYEITCALGPRIPRRWT